MQNKVFFKRHNYIRMFIHMQRLYQIGFNIKLCICQFTLPADLDISVERVFNIVYILVKFVMIIIFLFSHHSNSKKRSKHGHNKKQSFDEASYKCFKLKTECLAKNQPIK